MYLNKSHQTLILYRTSTKYKTRGKLKLVTLNPLIVLNCTELFTIAALTSQLCDILCPKLGLFVCLHWIHMFTKRCGILEGLLGKLWYMVVYETQLSERLRHVEKWKRSSDLNILLGLQTINKIRNEILKNFFLQWKRIELLHVVKLLTESSLGRYYIFQLTAKVYYFYKPLGLVYMLFKCTHARLHYYSILIRLLYNKVVVHTKNQSIFQ